MDQRDLSHLRFAITVAQHARDNGNHPFGAILAGPDDKLQKAENTVVTTGDCTAHAELNAIRLASQKFGHAFIASATMFASTEPCVMCSGAIYWSGITRLVYALDQVTFYEIIGGGVGSQPFSPPCRTVFARGTRPIEVEGPILVAEASQVHRDFWPAPKDTTHRAGRSAPIR